MEIVEKVSRERPRIDLSDERGGRWEVPRWVSRFDSGQTHFKWCNNLNQAHDVSLSQILEEPRRSPASSPDLQPLDVLVEFLGARSSRNDTPGRVGAATALWRSTVPLTTSPSRRR